MQKIKIYLKLMRFDKPIGILLLLWPTLWALWVAAEGVPPLKILIIFILGTVVMRAAGCVINDIADRDFDKLVQRTRERPLTAGDVNLKEAWILFGILMSFAFALVLLLNRFSIQLAFVGAALSILYPFTKRFIQFPQFILGLAFAWGIPMAFAAINNEVPSLCFWLMSSAVILAMIYDTQYAMVDREDDLKIGIKSTAILFGRYDYFWIGALQLIFLLLLIVIGLKIKAHYFYYLSNLIVMGLFIYQQALIRKRQRENCFRAFLNNQWVGLAVFLGIVFSMS